MREIKYNEQAHAASGYGDWDSGVLGILESVDDQLAKEGLEVVLLDDGGDGYCWLVESRSAATVASDKAELAKWEAKQEALRNRKWKYKIGDVVRVYDPDYGRLWASEAVVVRAREVNAANQEKVVVRTQGDQIFVGEWCVTLIDPKDVSEKFAAWAKEEVSP